MIPADAANLFWSAAILALVTGYEVAKDDTY